MASNFFPTLSFLSTIVTFAPFCADLSAHIIPDAPPPIISIFIIPSYKESGISTALLLIELVFANQYVRVVMICVLKPLT